MSRAVAGALVVFGILLCMLCVGLATSIVDSTPDLDWQNDLKRYVAGSGGLLGISLFFLGAWRFSKKS